MTARAGRAWVMATPEWVHIGESEDADTASWHLTLHRLNAEDLLSALEQEIRKPVQSLSREQVNG